MTPFRSFILLAFALQLGARAHAHEFWIEPENFRPPNGSVVRVTLHVGHAFAGEPYAYDPDRIDKFVLIGADGEKPVMGRSGSTTCFARLESTGTHVLGYRSKHSYIELPAERFERYLMEEGLTNIISQRAQRGESDRPGKEVYSRCAKSLICAGSECSMGHDRPAGYILELIPVQNPFQLSAGEVLTVRVVFDGKPLPGAKVVAVNKGDPHSSSSTISDTQGQISFELAKQGTWLMTTIHMIPAPEGLGADWESLWASLTFEVPGPAGK